MGAGGASPAPAKRLPVGPGTLGRRTLGRASPRNSRGAPLRGAGHGSLTDVVARGAPRRGLGRHVGRLGPGTPSLCLAAWPSRWCLGREVPSHTPLAHVLASLLGPVRDLSVSALDSAADQLPGAGRTTHRASSSLLIGVRSVDNYGGPAQ